MRLEWVHSYMRAAPSHLADRHELSSIDSTSTIQVELSKYTTQRCLAVCCRIERFGAEEETAQINQHSGCAPILSAALKHATTLVRERSQYRASRTSEAVRPACRIVWLDPSTRCCPCWFWYETVVTVMPPRRGESCTRTYCHGQPVIPP